MKPIYRNFITITRPLWLVPPVLLTLFLCGLLQAATLEHLRPLEGRVVGDVSIEGARTTKHWVVFRELDTRSGRTLDIDLLQSDLVRIMNLSIFSSVSILADQRDSLVDLTLQVRELPPIIPFLGFSITDETGISAGPAVASPNLFGRDITLSGSLLLGGATQFRFVLDYPWILDPRTDLYVESALRERKDNVRGFNETSLEIVPVGSRWLGRQLSFLAGVSYFMMDADTNRVTLSPTGVDHLFNLALGFEVDARNNHRNPTNGWHALFNADMTFSAHGNFTGFGVDLRRYQHLAPRHSLALGILWNQQFSRVPDYLQFAMGGANSIRGYDVEELGKELRGKNEWINTLEYRFLLMPIREVKIFKWGVNIGLAGALFADAGSAWNTSDEFQARNFRTGVGTGLRLLVPATEMIRLGAAMGKGGIIQVYVRGGSKFEMQRKRLR